MSKEHFPKVWHNGPCEGCQKGWENERVRTRASLDQAEAAVREAKVSTFSGICRKCSTLRDEFGECGCNAN
jgi:hypothetical protein